MVKKVKTGNRLTTEAKAQAKEWYMQYQSMSEIARQFNVCTSTIKYWADKEWSHERMLKETEVFKKLNDSKGSKFASMTSAAITIMERSLVALAQRPDPPTMQEARQASEVLGQIDRITRLDKGDPTDIISDQNQSMTVEGLSKKLKTINPFHKEEYIEYRESEKENEQSTKNEE